METMVVESPVNYINHTHTVASWLLTKDHKRIGILYLIVVSMAAMLGGLFAAVIRVELTTPQGDLLSAAVYNHMFTIHGMRAPGMTWFRLPLFIWAMYATSLVMILGTPVIAITLLMLVLERGLHLGIFDPRLGGDPVLFQHLFWFYSHPAVYIMILPGMGVISEIVPCFARRQIFGYPFIAFSSLGIAMIGFLVLGHHLFVTGQSV